jgi:tetratricopeptide (TPR) repeat protein
MTKFLGRLAVPVLFLFSLGLYFRTTGYELIGDDAVLILGNPYVRSVHFLREILTQNFWAFQGLRGNSIYYRPVLMLAFLVLTVLFRPHPAPFHAFTTLLNAVVVVLVYKLAKRLGMSEVGAWIAATLFAVLAIHVEAIAVVSGASDLMCAVFILCAMLVYVRGTTRRHAWGAAVLLLGAMLSKELAFVSILLLAFYEHFMRQDRTEHWQRVERYFPTCLLTVFAFVAHRAAVGPVQRIRFSSSVPFLFSQVGQYMAKLICPQHLTYSWPYQPAQAWTEPYVLFGAGVLLWATVVAPATWRRNRLVAFTLFWLFLFILPMIRIGFPGTSVLAERYLYIPSVGFCWLVGIAVSNVSTPRLRIAALAGTATIIVLMAVQTERYLPSWRDRLALSVATLKENPDSGPFLGYMATYYIHEGDLSKARAYYMHAAADDPPIPEAYVNLASMHMNDGDYQGAWNMLWRGISVAPGYSKPFILLARIARIEGDVFQSEMLLRRALDCDPNDYEALLHLGVLKCQQGHKGEASSLLARAKFVNADSTIECSATGGYK